MKSTHIDLFIDSARHVCSTMLYCEIIAGALRSSDTQQQTSLEGDMLVEELADPPIKKGLTAFIGLTGRTSGTVALCFPADTAVRAAQQILAMPEITQVDQIVIDTAAEMVNMVAGSAKSQLAENGEAIYLTLPTVVPGNDFQIIYPSDSQWLEVPFGSVLGNFEMQVCLRG